MNSLLVSKGYKPRRGVIKICSYCQAEFYRQPCHAHYKTSFCSRKHQLAYSKENSFYFNCLVCNKQVFTQPAQIKYRNRRTCSHECSIIIRKADTAVRHKTYTKHQLDRLARYSPEAAEWRKQVFERDDYTCQFCEIRGGRLEADHIKPWAYFPDLRFELSNGRTLCRPCHDTTKMSAKAMRKLYESQ